MDLSTILPLIMNSGSANGGGDNRIASILSAMNGGQSAQTNGENAGFANDGNAALLSSLMGANGGGDKTASIMNMLSLANKNRAQPRPKGLKPIKDIVPNDILGIMVKRLNS